MNMIASTRLRAGRLAALAILTVVAFALSGCMKFKQKLILQPDMSGEAHISVVISYEDMARATVNMTKMMMDDDTPATEAEIQLAMGMVKEKMAEEDMSKEQAELDEQAAKIRDALPEGIVLDDYAWEVTDASMGINLKLGFDHLDKLMSLSGAFLAEHIPMAQAGASGSDSSLFGSLAVTEKAKGKKLQFKGIPLDLSDLFEDDDSLGIDMSEMMEVMMPGFEGIFELETPMGIGPNNAHEKEDGVLRWRWDVKKLKKLAKGKGGVKFTLKR